MVSRTRVEDLVPDSIMSNAHLFGGNHSNILTQGLTVGIGTVMDAKEVNSKSNTTTVVEYQKRL